MADAAAPTSSELADTIEVSRALAAAPRAAWQALTDSDTLQAWYGATLTPPLHTGERTILDFGDGEFITLDNVVVVPTQLVKFDWRVMGIGTATTVRWSITDRPTGCLVTVTDVQPRREQRVAERERRGWAGFLRRLELHLSAVDVGRQAARG